MHIKQYKIMEEFTKKNTYWTIQICSHYRQNGWSDPIQMVAYRSDIINYMVPLGNQINIKIHEFSYSLWQCLMSTMYLSNRIGMTKSSIIGQIKYVFSCQLTSGIFVKRKENGAIMSLWVSMRNQELLFLVHLLSEKEMVNFTRI